MSKDITITRTFNAPQDLVWKMWADSDLFMKWWGPQYFTSPVCKMDFKQGGKYLWCMQSPDGQKFFSTGIFNEITPKTKITFTDSFADENGNVVTPATYGMPEDFPMETVTNVTFEEKDGKTTMTIVQFNQPEGEASDMAVAGWNGSLDKMEAVLGM